jgi:hypothetical protein
MIKRDTETYSSLLKSMASLSGLFSQSSVPYINSRFVEKLFVITTGALDLGRRDKSFDALLPGGQGVGVKTFTAPTGNSKLEKVAEFTAMAGQGKFQISDKEKLVKVIASARNQRILSNAAEYAIDLSKCVYHCLIRFDNGACVHEEPYQLIDLGNLTPLNRSGHPAKSWTFDNGNIYFSDGLSAYSYSLAKNVLMKRFVFDRQENTISLTIDQNPLAILDKLVGRTSSKLSTLSSISIDIDESEQGPVGVPGKDFVILPLYSLRDNKVPLKSGINQWNAGGRSRKFGEAYIPVPALIHQRFPAFFPLRDQHFSLELPNGSTPQLAKICQDGGKALMTESNIELGKWIISVIDPLTETSEFSKPPSRSRRPFTYNDLVTIGSDSVLVERLATKRYAARFAGLGTFEEFERSTRSS